MNAGTAQHREVAFPRLSLHPTCLTCAPQRDSDEHWPLFIPDQHKSRGQ